MRYLEVSCRVARELSDAAATLFVEIGEGVVIDDPQDVINRLESQAWDFTDLEAGDPRWVTVKIYLPETDNLEEKQLKIQEAVSTLRNLEIGQLEEPSYRWTDDQDWANAWKQYFKPLPVGERLVIIPSWEHYELRPNQIPLYLDPGMAFGTGTHATTSLCLRWLDELVTPGAKVLDVGTGSGILAVAAKKLGAGPTLAIDIDQVATQVAQENLTKNQVDADVAEAELDSPTVEAWVADYGKPNLIVANILAHIIIEIAPRAFQLLTSKGHFVTSGIIVEKADAVKAALLANGFTNLRQKEEGGWVAILAVKP